jgi:diaminopimelate epimerase
VKFTKYCSNGNDFVLFDGAPEGDSEMRQRLCDRRFGIGADGILYVLSSEQADFVMKYFNSDGNQVEMCGNGARAVARHFFINNPDKTKTSFLVGSDLYSAQINSDGLVGVGMNVFRDYQSIPLDDLELTSEIVDRAYLYTGVPHLVLEYSGKLELAPLEKIAPPLRYDQRFNAGVNVNLYVFNGSTVHVRTWERGVEAETFACGTGVTAIARHLWESKRWTTPELTIFTRGGKLVAQKTATGLDLYGDSQQVFTGNYSPL